MTAVRPVLALLAVAAVGACNGPIGGALAPGGSLEPLAGATLRGRVDFGSARAVQATMSDVAIAATVSLIDTQSNKTIAATTTDDSGSFKLAVPGFVPAQGNTYYLEAVKGLSSNSPGVSAARVRTVAAFNSGWSTLTTPGIVLSPATTALSVAGALRGVSDFTPFLGKLDVSGSTVYTPAGAVSAADYTGVLGIVNAALQQNLDPVASVALQSGNLVPVLGQDLAAGGLAPNTAMTGANVTVTGAGFATTASNVVSFNGVAAPAVASSNGTTLSVVVPADASSGQITVTVGNTTVLGPLFSVLPRITSVTPLAGVAGPASGKLGSVITIYGTGFGSTPTVKIGSAALTVLTKSNTAIAAQMPFGVTSGAVQVTAGGNTAGGPTVSIVPNAQSNGTFDALADGNDPTFHTSDGGSTTQSVVTSGTSRSASKLLRFTYSGGSHRARLAGITPTKKVIVAGFWVRHNTSLNSWAPTSTLVFGKSIVPVYVGIWGTPWLTTLCGPTYPCTVVPDTAYGTVYPVADTWQYIQATASVDTGKGYQYGSFIQGNPWSDNGFMFDVDDVVLFDSD